MHNELKNMRITNGFTQEKLAEVLGYKSKSGYSMLESGKVSLSIRKAKKLAEFYKVGIEKFLNI